MNWIKGIAFGAPFWVWPLLIFLIFLGFRSTKARSVHVIGIYLLPLFSVMALNSMVNLPRPDVAVTMFALGLFLGGIYGFRKQRQWLISVDGTRVSVAGEWLTLIVLLIIFWSNFTSGVVQAVSPETYQGLPFLFIYTLILGCASGTFIGRAIQVVRIVRYTD